MAAIPDAGSAQCAPRGVLRALLPGTVLRVAMLGGLVITGWLLASGIAQAHENPGLASAFSGLSGVNEVRIAPLSPLNATDTPPSDEVVGGVGSGVVRAVPVGRAQVPVLGPVLEPVSMLAAPASKKATPSRAAAHQPAVVPPPAAPAEPIAPATAVTTPAPVLHTVSDALSETPVRVAAYPVADPPADQVAWSAAPGPSALGPSTLGPSTPGSGPATPVPASPSGTTTAPCPGGNGGGGSTTKSDLSVTLSDGWATTGPTPTLLRLCAGAGGIPPWAAQRPTTSPD